MCTGSRSSSSLFEELQCECGAELEYDTEGSAGAIFYHSRIKTACDECGEKVDVSNLVAIYDNGWTRKRIKVKGGAASCFAFAIDCGKCLPGGRTEHSGAALHPELIKLLEETFQTNFYEVGDFY